MDLIDEEDISGFERIEDADDLGGFGDGISCDGFDVDLSLSGDDVRHRRLPESAGTGKKDMPHMSFPYLSALDGCLDDSFDMFLTDEFLERIGSS